MKLTPEDTFLSFSSRLMGSVAMILGALMLVLTSGEIGSNPVQSGGLLYLLGKITRLENKLK